MRVTRWNSARLLTVVAAFAASATVPNAAHAQHGVLVGSVATDSLGKHTLPGALLSMPALQLTTTANFAGEYRFAGLPAGRYLVVVDVKGYKSVGERVVIAEAGETYHDFVISAKVSLLDSVVATASADAPPPRSATLRAVEERRKRGIGRFVTEEELRREEDRALRDVLRQHIPGIDIVPVGMASYLATVGSGGGADTVRAMRMASKPRCYPAVYVDGLQIAKVTDPQVSSITAVDLNQFTVTQFAAIEFYASGTVPPQFDSSTQGGCGALLLWTRER
jgi:hypothetical protein